MAGMEVPRYAGKILLKVQDKTQNRYKQIICNINKK